MASAVLNVLPSAITTSELELAGFDPLGQAVPDPLAPGGQLTSVRQLDEALGNRRSLVAALTTRQLQDQQRLAHAAAQVQHLTQAIAQLQGEMELRQRNLATLTGEVDHLLEVQAALQARSLAASRRAQQLGPALLQAAVRAGERRQDRRQPLVIEITGGDETQFYTGFTQDISQGGLFVATYVTAAIGDRFPIVFTLPGERAPVHCIVEVAWVREYRDDHGARAASPGMGLRFIALEPQHRIAIDRFLQRCPPLFVPEPDDLS